MADKLIDNYIYLFHTDEWVLIPEYPDTLSDKMGSTFASQDALSRTAPVYSYSHSGPREVNVSISLRRDMFNSLNYANSNLKVDITDDYVDTIIKRIQAIALPTYVASAKLVNPPKIAVRFGEDLFVKGIVNGGVSVTYEKPLLNNRKYAGVTIAFNVYETTPYDADTVSELGSFRGVTKQFKNGIYKES